MQIWIAVKTDIRLTGVQGTHELLFAGHTFVAKEYLSASCKQAHIDMSEPSCVKAVTL